MNNFLSTLQKWRNLPPYEFVWKLRELRDEEVVLNQQEILELLGIFCEKYWSYDKGRRYRKFSSQNYQGFKDLSTQQDFATEYFSAIVKKSFTPDMGSTLIPALVDKSILCNAFVSLAKVLFEKLTCFDKLGVNFIFPDLYKSKKYTLITAEEYSSGTTDTAKSWTRDENGVTKTYYSRRILPTDNNRRWMLEEMAAWQTPAKLAEVCHELRFNETVLFQDDALKLLDVFCNKYWELEEQQETAFDDFCALCKKGSLEARVALIPELMNQSIVCNDFVFLAKELLEVLSDKEKKDIDIYFPNWTKSDTYTVISAAEYHYRQIHGLKCWKQVNIFEGKPCGTPYPCRPMSIHDFDCFYCMMEVALLTGNEAITYLPGNRDETLVLDE